MERNRIKQGIRLRHVLVFFIRVYQKATWWKPRTCRYEPSCSAYAAQAVLMHGPIKGIGMAAWRILRCNPWSPGGDDPVPDPLR